MAKAYFAKHMRSLHPADDDAADLVKKLGAGEIVEIEIRRPRNAKHHRLFWKLCTLVWENIADHDTYPTPEAIVDELKILTGHCERRYIMVNGERYLFVKPKSISYGAMDQDEFSAFFDNCGDIIEQRWMHGITNEELRNELEAMMGAR